MPISTTCPKHHAMPTALATRLQYDSQARAWIAAFFTYQGL